EAARRTGIAKSAVSRRIALVEQRLGVQLLRRSSRAIQVTTDGARFYEHCKKVLDAARAAEAALSGASERMAGAHPARAPGTFPQMFLARAIGAFQVKNPEVEVDLQANDRLVDATTTELDLIVRVTRLGDGAFVAKRLCTDRLVIAGAPDYLERRGRPRR